MASYSGEQTECTQSLRGYGSILVDMEGEHNDEDVPNQMPQRFNLKHPAPVSTCHWILQRSGFAALALALCLSLLVFLGSSAPLVPVFLLLPVLPSKQQASLPAKTSIQQRGTETTTTAHARIVYFGYGAMCNPVSRQRRKIVARRFSPGILRDFALDFSNAGVANILPQPGSEVQGVLMEFDSLEMWQRVQGTESGYIHQQVYVTPYPPMHEIANVDVENNNNDFVGSDPVLAHVFYMDDQVETTEHQGLPQERYLKTIVQGMQFHGVDPNYIATNIQNVPCIPARTPEHYIQFPKDPEPLPTISYQDYQTRAMTVPCLLLHDQVVDLECTEKVLGTYHDQPLVKFLRAKAIGKPDFTSVLLDQLYDPDLPPNANSTWQWKWAEDQLADLLAASNMSECPLITRRLNSAVIVENQ